MTKYRMGNMIIGPVASLPATGEDGGATGMAPFGAYLAYDTAELYIDNGTSGWTKFADVGITAAAAAADFAVTGNETVGGTLAVTGASTFTGAVDNKSTTALEGHVTVSDAKNIVVGSGTGTKIGTATSQKLAFFNASPIAQPANTVDLRVALISLGLVATGGANPLDLNGGALTAGATQVGTLAATDTVTVTDAKNIVVGSGTGTKIATATSQKLGFYNASPVAQQSITGVLSTVADGPAKAVLTAIVTALANLGLAANNTS